MVQYYEYFLRRYDMADNYITRKMDKGTINISEDVITSLVKSALLETEGVADLANASGAEIAELTGYKTNVRGVKIRYQEERLIVDAVITVSYGNNIIDVARKAQEAVLTAVQSSTGFDAAEVNVHVTGIVF